MKKIYLTLISLFFAISCFEQGIEVYGSLNTSSEQRFQSGYGIGLQFQQNLSHKFIAVLGRLVITLVTQNLIGPPYLMLTLT